MEESEEVARHVGQIVAILDIMNLKYPSFKSLISFQIKIDDEQTVQGANISNFLEEGDLTELLVNVQDAYAKRYHEGADFEVDLEYLISKLKDDIGDDPSGQN